MRVQRRSWWLAVRHRGQIARLLVTGLTCTNFRYLLAVIQDRGSPVLLVFRDEQADQYLAGWLDPNDRSHALPRSATSVSSTTGWPLTPARRLVRL